MQMIRYREGKSCSPMPPGGTERTTRPKSLKCYIKHSVYTLLCKISIFSFNICDILKERNISLLRKLTAYYATLKITYIK